MTDSLELIELDLDNEQQFTEIYSEVKNIGNYFKPENDVTYKINLTSSIISPITKIFSREGVDQTVKKYVLTIRAISGKDKSVYEGVWEAGSATLKKVLDIILESPKKSTEVYFRMKKTGIGLQTDYDIMSDEF